MQQDQIDIKYVIREIEAMIKVKGERIVRYMDSCVDHNNNVYIQMEFCSNNLENILQSRRKVFPRSDSQPMNRIEYYICWQIFIELLEAVDYLHQYNPQIMHRDLKPNNILFDDKGINGIFFKVCDFGLAKVNSDLSHTSNVGHIDYIAPEVNDGHKYDTKSDVYSLARIGCKLFEVNLARYDPN